MFADQNPYTCLWEAVYLKNVLKIDKHFSISLCVADFVSLNMQYLWAFPRIIIIQLCSDIKQVKSTELNIPQTYISI